MTHLSDGPRPSGTEPATTTTGRRPGRWPHHVPRLCMKEVRHGRVSAARATRLSGNPLMALPEFLRTNDR